MIDPKWHKARIERERLVHSSPETVYELLEKRAKEREEAGNPWGGNLKELEGLLLRRNHPLIDLALAQFGEDRRVLQTLFSRGSRGVRSACLGNRYVGPDDNPLTRSLTNAWMDGDMFNEIVSTGDGHSLAALFTNPDIDSDALSNLYDREPPFDAIDDDRWEFLVWLTSKNPIWTKGLEVHGPPYDFYRWQYASGPFESAAELAKYSPVNAGWAITLYLLLEQVAKGRRLDLGLGTIRRWYDHEAGDKEHEYFGKLRTLIALSSSQVELDEIKDSDDLALRRAYYGRFRPKGGVAELDTCFEKDGKEFIEAAIRNHSLYMNEETREHFRDLVSSVDEHGFEIQEFNRAYEDAKERGLVNDESSGNANRGRAERRHSDVASMLSRLDGRIWRIEVGLIVAIPLLLMIVAQAFCSGGATP